VNLICLFMLVPAIGLIGVPISLACSALTMFVASWVVSERLYHVGFSKVAFIIPFAITAAIVVGTVILELSLIERVAMCSGMFAVAAGYFLNRARVLRIKE